jgi:hypothetical protein
LLRFRHQHVEILTFGIMTKSDVTTIRGTAFETR